jgi:hypothetical protein
MHGADAMIYSKNKPTHETVKEEKQTSASFAILPQTASYGYNAWQVLSEDEKCIKFVYNCIVKKWNA